ncbi:MAG: hypothetical protein JNK33_00765 [Candidatus Doudnabacteria bacterium]|nr:hypothetical protein [Candidatus Doudnabacteria bacterium]
MQSLGLRFQKVKHRATFFRNPGVHILILTLIVAGTQWYNWGIFGDPDAQFHLTVARLMPAWPTSTQFFWLPFTSWGTAYADQHYLFHLFLKPLVLLGAGQIVIVLGFLLNLLGFNWLLKQVTTHNRSPWLWLYAFGSADLFTRVSLIKAEATGMVFLFLLTGLLIKRKWQWLLPIMALYTLWYGASTLCLVVLATYCATELFLKKTLLFRPVCWALAGLFLGLVIHPQSAALPALLYDQITGAGLLRVIPGGNEWYAQPAAFLPDNILVLLPWVISLFYIFKARKNTPQTLWFIALSSCALFLLALYSNRLTLYWVPFAVLLMAHTLPSPVQKIYRELFSTPGQTLRKVLVVLLIALAASRGLQNIYNITTTIHRIGLPVDRLRTAAEWLNAHTQPGDVITNTSWHIFPELFYWNTKNRYIAGEDPAFLWIADPDRYTVWKRLEHPTTQNEYGIGMRAFQSTWLITPHVHNAPADSNPHLRQVYADESVRILHLTK